MEGSANLVALVLLAQLWVDFDHIFFPLIFIQRVEAEYNCFESGQNLSFCLLLKQGVWISQDNGIS